MTPLLSWKRPVSARGDQFLSDVVRIADRLIPVANAFGLAD